MIPKLAKRNFSAGRKEPKKRPFFKDPIKEKALDYRFGPNLTKGQVADTVIMAKKGQTVEKSEKAIKEMDEAVEALRHNGPLQRNWAKLKMVLERQEEIKKRKQEKKEKEE